MTGRRCVCKSQHVENVLKSSLLSATALSTMVLSGLAIWTYAENGLLYPCPEKSDTLMDPWQHHHYISMPLLRVFVAMLGALVMEYYSASDHLRLASWLGLVNWNCQAGVAASVLTQCHGAEAEPSSQAAWVLQTSLALWAISAFACMLCLLGRVIYERWLRLEIVSGGRHREAWRRTLIGFLVSMPLSACLVALVMASPGWPRYVLFATSIPWLFGCRFACLAWPSLRLAMAARRAASRALPGRAQRIRLAAKSVLLQFVGSIAGVLSSVLFTLLQLLVLGLTPETKQEEKLLQRSYDFVSLLDLCCNTFLMLALAGILSGAGRSARLKHRTARARQGRWRRNWESWQQRGHTNTNTTTTTSTNAKDPDPESLQLQLQWDEKVRELAGRGVSLGALLQFYRQTLPGAMPHFDPEIHTTGNVVFEAVIPYTSEQGCAAAELMMAGDYVLPQKMVTHNWSNRFSDLLAAIVSDAIGESDFGMVAWLLVHDPDRLEAWIADRQVGCRTYWVCAFAVNQHVSICGARDRVCRCGRQKLLNDSPPLMPDGSSIPCEVNKFDTMMKYLSAENPAFEQVVAVDAKCDLFWRAWCISEIATAHETGMPQSLKVTSPDCLEANVKKLGQLKIEDMEASRKEDKELILSRIESPEAFNRTLRHVLLNEVIPAWSSLDASEQMSLAGCIICWQRVSQQRGDLAVWAA